MNRCHLNPLWLVKSILMFLVGVTGFNVSADSLKPWSKNPWYWEYQGEPVLLLGGSDDDNLFQWPKDRLIPQLDRILQAGGNVIRNTMSDRNDKGFELYPFKQLPSGKYDLNQWNVEYWDRFDTMLKETSERRIFVQIEIWDRFDYTDNRGSNRWQLHPYNPKNNVNYDYAESGFSNQYPDHPGANKQPFFYTTPKQRNNGVVLSFQRKFVSKLLDHSLKFDHVLYCMDNETKAEPAWGIYWASFVKERAQREGVRVNVTEMWDDWNLKAERHRLTFDNVQLYDFVDVSQNNHNSGRKHWDNFLYVKNYLSNHPRPINTTKTYGATGNKFGHNDQDAIERYWRHLLAGAASARFHRPDSGLGINDKAFACIKSARLVEKAVSFWDLSPAMNLVQTAEDNDAYAAENAGEAMVIFITGQHRVNVDLKNLPDQFQLTWIDVDQGVQHSGKRIQSEGYLELIPPHKGNWVGVLTALN